MFTIQKVDFLGKCFDNGQIYHYRQIKVKRMQNTVKQFRRNVLLFYTELYQKRISMSTRNIRKAPLHESEHEQQGVSQHFQAHEPSESNTQYLAIVVFAILIAAIGLFKIFTSYNDDVKNGRFYSNHLMSLDLISEWKMSQTQMITQQQNSSKKIIEKSQHQISREQLGHQSWSLLHMMTGSFPEKFDDNLRDKFNTFLVLFGQMYPCKMCANHFMQLLKKEGLFTGNTKKQLMEYLCYLHNKVNERLGHPIHDCSNVVEEWNTCGCDGEPNA